MKKRWMKTVSQMILAGALAVNMMAGIPVMAESPAAVSGTSGEQTDVYEDSNHNLHLGKDGNPTNPVTGQITVSGVKEEGATVTAYQIADGYYNDDCKLVKYVLMDGTNAPIAGIGDESKGQTEDNNDIITHAEITKIAKAVKSGAFTADKGVTCSRPDMQGNYTFDVEPGLYLILVNSPENSEWVYNPAVAAININNVNTGSLDSAKVDMSDFFKEADRNSELCKRRVGVLCRYNH